MQYERNDMNLVRGTFRVRGDTLTVFPAYEDLAVRVDFWGDEIERIVSVDPLSGELLSEQQRFGIYPAKHFVTSEGRLETAVVTIEEELREQTAQMRSEGRILEATRLEERTRYDLEMLRETGYCSGIENYSRHLAGRAPGLDAVDAARLLPGRLAGVRRRVAHRVAAGAGGCTSATSPARRRWSTSVSGCPRRSTTGRSASMSLSRTSTRSSSSRLHRGRTSWSTSDQVVEQVIRPTGIVDPAVEVRETQGQIDDLLAEINERAARNERVLVTTLTKKMSEDLTDYLLEIGVKAHYLHSEIDTLERIEILRDLRQGVYDVVVGINLLREGLDLPEVSLVCILDADKEGFLRSGGSLIQTIGRAARHPDGRVIMYADYITDSMAAPPSTRPTAGAPSRPRTTRAHGVGAGGHPQGDPRHHRPPPCRRGARRLRRRRLGVAARRVAADGQGARRQDEDGRARELEFEHAAQLRDQIVDLRRELVGDTPEGPPRLRIPLGPSATREWWGAAWWADAAAVAFREQVCYIGVAPRVCKRFRVSTRPRPDASALPSSSHGAISLRRPKAVRSARSAGASHLLSGAERRRLAMAQQVDPDLRTRLGQFLTPPPVAALMASMFRTQPRRCVAARPGARESGA